MFSSYSKWVWVGLLLGVIAIATALVFLSRYRPIEDFVFASGREGGAYYNFALEYQKHLADTGYTMTVLPTAGSVAILEQLNAGNVEVGFVQGGTGSSTDTKDLVSLGSVFYEPLWIFYVDEAFAETPGYMRDLKGKRIAVGEEGSGSALLARQLLTDNDITEENSELLPLSIANAYPLLQEGELDAVLFVSAPVAPIVREMLSDPTIKPLQMTRTLAYHRRYPYLTAVTLGEGSIDLAENIPSTDLSLLATAASLVARNDISPDIKRLVLSEAEAVHGNGGLLEEQGEFPSTQLVEIPMDEDAQRYLEDGPTGLERYLPYWLASRLEWFIFIVLPLLVLAYPIFRTMPVLFDNFIRIQIHRWYLEVRKVEQQLPSLSIDEIDQKIEWLDDLHEILTKKLRVPMFFLHEFYQLRSNLSMVIQRLEKRRDFLRKRAEQSAPAALEATDISPDSATLAETDAATPMAEDTVIVAESGKKMEAELDTETVADSIAPHSQTEGRAEAGE